MRLLSTLLLCCFAFMVVADEPDPPLPALYAVIGVDENDVLNIRSMPSASADIIGTLAANADKIEVVAFSRAGQWAQINTGERSGWVSVRYLRATPTDRSGLGLPVGLQCFGTEPFWSMTFSNQPVMTLRTPESQTSHELLSFAPSTAFVDLSQSGLRFTWQDTDGPVTAYILTGNCNDGMSDRAYGLHYFDDLGPRVGCCSLN